MFEQLSDSELESVIAESSVRFTASTIEKQRRQSQPVAPDAPWQTKVGNSLLKWAQTNKCAAAISCAAVVIYLGSLLVGVFK